MSKRSCSRPIFSMPEFSGSRISRRKSLHPVVLIECPRMLFPFARQVLADATRNGGFPPLMLDPIDFAGMYQKRLAQSQTRA